MTHRRKLSVQYWLKQTLFSFVTAIHTGVEVLKKSPATIFVASAGDKKSTATFCRLRRQCGRDFSLLLTTMMSWKWIRT